MSRTKQAKRLADDAKNNIVLDNIVSDHSTEADYRNIRIEPVNIAFGKNQILDSAKLVLNHGNHYFVVGRNGIGKTSLLDAIYNRTIPVSQKTDMQYITQSVNVLDENNNILDLLLASNELLVDMQRQLDALNQIVESDEIESNADATESNADAINIMYQKLDDLTQRIGSETTTSRIKAKKILLGLGFSERCISKSLKEFSGGWRMRASLARALYMQPTLLILDEPTNHLDLHTNIWLMGYLSTYPGTTLIVSHDQHFINSTATHIILIENRKLMYYNGNYDKFLQQRELEMQKQQKDWEKFEKALAIMRSKQKKPVEIQQFVKLHGIVKPEKSYTVKMNFVEPKIIGDYLIKLTDCMFAYNPLVHLPYTDKPFSLAVSSGRKVAIVGKNGCGKSTLIRLIAGELEPTSGSVSMANNLRIGYYNQHFEDSLPRDTTTTACTYLQQLNPSFTVPACHRSLSMFGLESQYHNQTIHSLSGGQKARVKFASFGALEPHVLLLDEPTNHLDIQCIESLIYALNEFNGAVVLITHNFDLIQRLKCELLVVKSDSMKMYAGSCEELMEEIIREL